MQERPKAWYDRKWLVPAFAFLTLVSVPFREDIRDGVLTVAGVALDRWWFDVILTVGLIGLAAVVMFKSDRATRACQDLQEHLRENLANHRGQLSSDLADNREELNAALTETS